MSEEQLNSTMMNTKKVLDWLADYHEHKVYGLENFPKEGSCLLITNHSLATYDGFILGMRVYEHTGRLIRGLGDNMLFRFGLTKKFCEDVGIVPASPENAKKLLEDGEVLGIAPGGMRESLKPSEEKYKVLWDKRKGFIKLSVETNTPIVLSACPSADLIYKIFPSHTTAAIYKHFKFPMPIFHGIGPTFLPRPVKLTHLLSEPILPPEKRPNESLDQQVERFHKIVVDRMEYLMEAAREASRKRL